MVLAACGVGGPATAESQSAVATPAATPRAQFPELAEFDAVQVDGPLLVELRTAGVAAVEVSTSGLDPSSVVVASEGGVLRLGIAPGVDWADIGEVSAVVSAPSLRSLELTGAARARTGAAMELQGLILDLADASSFNAVVNVSGGVLAEVGGSSTLDLDGTAGSFEVVVADGSTTDSEGLRAGDVRVTASGASRAAVQVAGVLGVRATGGSTVRYSGQPTLVVDDIDSSSQLVPPQ